MQADWAYNEIYRANLWDKRCYKTLQSALQKLGENAEVSFSRALGSQRKAVSHILHHEQTTAEDLLEGHIQATKRRCLNENFILVASDTTLADFTSHPATEGLGHISHSKNQRGFPIHSALAMTTQGIPLGLLHQKSWIRDPEEFGKADERRKRPFEEKESHKWVDALRSVEENLSKNVKALLIQDREADIFEFFAAKRQENVDLLIRATQPRRIEAGAEGSPTSLLEAIAQAPVVATTSVAVRERPDREAREARLVVRVMQVKVCRPRDKTSVSADPILLTVIRASEENPPAGVKTPLEWVLLTTLSVPDAETALVVVGYYAKRWLIERFHYVLKSGCEFEKLQMDTFSTLQKALSLYSIVAWRLLHLTYLAREAPQTPVYEVLSDVERTVLESATGRTIKTVAQVVMEVSRIAGFCPVPSAPNPGVKSLWLGFRKLQDMVAGFLLARKALFPT